MANVLEAVVAMAADRVYHVKDPRPRAIDKSKKGQIICPFIFPEL